MNRSQLFPGEIHQILTLPNGSKEFANFSGPGTHVLARIKRGDRGKTIVDKIAEAHDIRYFLAGLLSPNERNKAVREADKIMLSELNKAMANNADIRQNLLPAYVGIGAKVIGEEFSILKKGSFAKPGSVSPEDKKLLERTLAKLGY